MKKTTSLLLVSALAMPMAGAAVAQDKAAAASGVQDVITKYNALLKTYKEASAVTQNSDGSLTKGPLASDSTAQSFMAKNSTALVMASEA